eukprot:6193684-Pleurochrysis_carterae.AAC.1
MRLFLGRTYEELAPMSNVHFELLVVANTKRRLQSALSSCRLLVRSCTGPDWGPGHWTTALSS